MISPHLQRRIAELEQLSGMTASVGRTAGGVFTFELVDEFGVVSMNFFGVDLESAVNDAADRLTGKWGQP